MIKEEYLDELAEAISKIKTPQKAKELLNDILTPNEINDVVSRLQIIKLLKQGFPQREIAKMLKISIAKVTHGSRYIQEHQNSFSFMKNNKNTSKNWWQTSKPS